MRRWAVALVCGGLLVAGCGAPSGPEAGLTKGRGSDAAAAVAAEPAPVVASTVAPATTVFVPTTTTTTEPIIRIPGPGPGARATAPLTPRPAPAGVSTTGAGGLGWLKTSSSGSTSGSLELYPADQYLGEWIHATAKLGYTGALKSAQIDFGDGSQVDEFPSPPAGECSHPAKTSERTLFDDKIHGYAKAGTYTVTVTVTVVDCSPPGFGWVHEMLPYLPDGRPTPNAYPPIGAETTLTLSMTVVIWPNTPPVGWVASNGR